MKILFICLFFIGSPNSFVNSIDEATSYFRLLTNKSKRVWIESDGIPNDFTQGGSKSYTFFKNNTLEIREEFGEIESYYFVLELVRNRVILKYNGNEYYVSDVSDTKLSNSEYNCLRFSKLNLDVSRNMTHIFLYSPK